MSADDAERFRLPDDTIELGRRHIAAYRARLGPRTDTTPPVSRPDPPAARNPKSTTDDWTSDQIRAEMAAGAERDHLADRVAELEREVKRLRNALAAVLDAAAGGLREPSTNEVTQQPAPPTS